MQLATLKNAADMLRVQNFTQFLDIFGDEKKARNFCGLVYACFQNEPKLLQCTRESVLTSVLQAAECDLVPGSAMQHCFLIPYKTHCQLQIGYRGLAEMVQREGAVKKVWANIVYQDEVDAGRFEVDFGSGHRLRHDRDPFRDDPPSWEGLLEAGMCGAYACAELASGAVNFEVAGLVPLKQARAMSRSDAWKEWASEMVKKFPLKRLCKRLPKTLHMERYWGVEEQLGKQDAVVLEAPAGADPDIWQKLDDAAGLLTDEQFAEIEKAGFPGVAACTQDEARKWYMRIKEMLS